MSKVETVGVVIVNYNAGDDVVECVKSLRAEGIEDIVVVDNGSSDGSDKKLVESDPKLKLLRLPNPGFGTANNHGAKELNTDVVFVLNPDTKVHKGAIEKLKAALDSDEKVAMVGPKLLNEDETLYPSARHFPNFADSAGHAIVGVFWKNNPWSRRYKRLDEDYATRSSVDWLSGSAMFTRKLAWDLIGGFDEGYWLYMEDVDLCWRLRQAGWNIVYEPSAVVTHVGGTATTHSSTPYKFLKIHHQSAVRYNFKTTKGPQRVLLPLVAAGLYLRLPIALAQRYLKDRKAKA